MLLSDFNRNIFSFIFVRLFVVFVSIHSKNDDMRATDSPFSTKKKPAENRKCCRSLELKMIINMEISVGSSFQKPKKIHRTTDETAWELIKILCLRSISAFFSHSSDLRFLIDHSVAYFPVLSRHQTNKRPLRSGLSAHSALSLSLFPSLPDWFACSGPFETSREKPRFIFMPFRYFGGSPYENIMRRQGWVAVSFYWVLLLLLARAELCCPCSWTISLSPFPIYAFSLPFLPFPDI